MNYQKLESIRELTVSEKNEFTQKALGMNFSEIESSLKKKAEGDTKTYEELLKTASKVNKTTPEQIESFFVDYIGE